MEHFQAEEGSRLLPSISITGQSLNDSTCKRCCLTAEEKRMKRGGKKEGGMLCLYCDVKE